MEAACLIDKVEQRRGELARCIPQNIPESWSNSAQGIGQCVEGDQGLARERQDDGRDDRRPSRTSKWRKRRREGKVIVPLAEDSIRIYHCPFQELEKVAGIAPASVNVFFADIPYTARIRGAS